MQLRLTPVVFFLVLSTVAIGSLLSVGCDEQRRRKGGEAIACEQGWSDACYCDGEAGEMWCQEDGTRSACSCEASDDLQGQLCTFDGDSEVRACDAGCGAWGGDQACLESGVWGECVCFNGDGSPPTPRACDENSWELCPCEGEVERICSDGVWLPCECDPARGCADGETRSCTCPDEMDGVQSCSEGEWSSCQGCGNTPTNNPSECPVPAVCVDYANCMEAAAPDWEFDFVGACVTAFDLCNTGDSCPTATPYVITCQLASGCTDDCNDQPSCKP